MANKLLESILGKIGYQAIEKTPEIVEVEKVSEIAEKAIGPLKDDFRIFNSLRSIFAAQGGSGVTAPYSQSVWVYSCINAIAQNLQRVPFVLKKDAGTLEPNIVESGPLYELFLNPNPYMTGKTLIEATFIYFGLRGESFWILDGRKNLTELPTQIWAFDPIRFEEVQDKKTGLITGWNYKGKEITYFPVEDIIHFKMFNPYNPLRGLAPIEAAQLSVDQDYQSSRFNKSFFDNGAKVGGFISIPEDTELTDEQYKRLVEQFEERHAGVSRAHKIAIVEGGGKFTEAKLTQKDMDFIEGKKMTRQEILSAYKVNEVILGVYTSMRSYEGIKAAHKAFWEECLTPKIEYFQEVLWAKFFSKVGSGRGKGRVWGEFDLANVGPLQANYQEKIKTAMNMFHMGWPINDINKRLQLGMKEVPWGNQWWVPGGFLPVTSIDSGVPGSKPKEPKEPKEPKDEKPKKDQDESVRFPMEVEFKSKIKKMLFEQRKKALSDILHGENWETAKGGKEYAKLKESLYTIYRDAAHCGAFWSKSQEELSEVIPLTEVEKGVSSYAEGRSLYVSNGYKTIIENFLSQISKADRSKEVIGDRTREIFNSLASKSSAMSKNEVDSAYIFGKELMAKLIRNALQASLLGDREEKNLIDIS